ncbi:MAG: hypothetical protein L3K09_03300, partial [Thermoplasmata archaeon]|nr:hypothetical protein [Thermoplasmata archaeon]
VPTTVLKASTGVYSPPHCFASVGLFAIPPVVHLGQVATLQTIIVAAAPLVGACSYPPTYVYSGLPPACRAVNTGTLYCPVYKVGTYNVHVQVFAPWGLFSANTMLTVVS